MDAEPETVYEMLTGEDPLSGDLKRLIQEESDSLDSIQVDRAFVEHLEQKFPNRAGSLSDTPMETGARIGAAFVVGYARRLLEMQENRRAGADDSER